MALASSLVRQLTLSAALAAGCGNPSHTPGQASNAGAGGAGSTTSVAGAAGVAGVGGGTLRELDFLSELASFEEYATLAGEGAEVKYLISVTGTTLPSPFVGGPCLFQNTAAYPYHVQFLRRFAEYAELDPVRYEDLVLRRSSRLMWGGALKLFSSSAHPVTGKSGVLAYTIYAGSSDDQVLRAEEIIEVDQRLKSCTRFAESFLVFTTEGTAQTTAAQAVAEHLRAAGVVFVEPGMLRASLAAEGYSDGEGYGYLRLIPHGSEPDWVSPRDVLVVDSAPNDLALVAGLVTARPQSIASHVNLRLREKAVPNASMANIHENALVSELGDTLVHIVVDGNEVAIEPASLAKAQVFWDTSRPIVGEPRADLNVAAWRGFDTLRASDATAFGTKAANLGELHQILAPSNRLEGFGIPFSAYVAFVSENGLEHAIETLLANPKTLTDAAYRRSQLAALRAAFLKVELSEEFAASLRAAIVATYGEAGLVTRLRFRSSTNAEDLAGVSGAGLYDSSSGCLADDLDNDPAGPSACLTEEQRGYLTAELGRRKQELAEAPSRTYLVSIIKDLESDLTKEKSASRAVRRVFASLWNDRAFDDREYYGLDHRRIFMGLAVHPAFVAERLEAVAFTNLEPNAAEPLYRVISQAGEIGVVRPQDPAATPEILSFRRTAANTASNLTLVAQSSLSLNGASLWTTAATSEVSTLLFQTQDHFAAQVYRELAPLSLDVEIDITIEGHIVIKQVRPYAR